MNLTNPAVTEGAHIFVNIIIFVLAFVHALAFVDALRERKKRQ